MTLATDGIPQPNFLRARDLALIVVVSLASTVILGFGTSRLVGSVDESGLSMAGKVLIFLSLQNLSVLGTVYLVALRWRGLRWSDLGLRPTSRSWLARAVYLGLAAYLLIAMAYAVIGHVLGGLPANPQLQMLAPAGMTVWGGIAMALMVCVLAPFVEEILFRGIFYAWLRGRWGVAVSSLVSGICFSLLHNIPWLIPAIALLGVLLAVIYEKSHSLWPSILTHCTFNTVTVVLLYALTSPHLAPH